MQVDCADDLRIVQGIRFGEVYIYPPLGTRPRDPPNRHNISPPSILYVELIYTTALIAIIRQHSKSMNVFFECPYKYSN